MKPSAPTILAAISAWVSLLASFLVVTMVWNVWVEGRAFRCTDAAGVGMFWTDLHEHRAAGDPVSPGWTWDQIGRRQRTYEWSFAALWISGGILLYFLLRGSRTIVKRFPSHGALSAEVADEDHA